MSANFVSHKVEQSAETLGRTLPPFAAQFYKGLKREDLPDEVVLALTQTWLMAFTQAAMIKLPLDEKEQSDGESH